MTLDNRIADELRQLQATMTAEGNLPSRAQLARYYETFRQRFGPDVLRNLDGEALLNMMHDHTNHDSLVYWLEFKNDDELPAIFGSIAGGSALKFGIYRRKETGAWMTGSSTKQVELTLADAVQIARNHRDQMLKGCELLDALPMNAPDEEYFQLQKQMSQAAPDVSDLGWVHKYFSMLYSEKLDDYHNAEYQRYHLIKLLELPPAVEGRYAVAGRFVAIAREMDITTGQLSKMLNRRDGNPTTTWRVLVNYSDPKWRRWDLMRDGGFVAIGWEKLGDLSEIRADKPSKEKVKALMKMHYNEKGGWAQEIFDFAATMQEGDTVVAFEHKTVLGIGQIAGGYYYDPTSDSPHRRQVKWLAASDTWELPQEEAEARTVRPLRLPQNLVEIERHKLGAGPIAPPEPKPPKPPSTSLESSKVFVAPRLEGTIGRIQAILERKGQVIVYGPPGTGKTYWALQAARELAAHHRFGMPFEQLSQEQRTVVLGSAEATDGLVRMCSFHPAYGYEDFLEGYKPVSVNNQLAFEKRDGIFMRLCADARRDPTYRYYLVVDEINRGDIPRIFGELLTVLEKDKRGQPILLPLSGTAFRVPDNVYVIGTMNTADRSIALLDTALRRRFGFVELMPSRAVLGNVVIHGIPLGPWLEALNNRICQYIGRDARNLQVGHAYLLKQGRPIDDFATLARVLQDDIVPLLEEYCYEDYEALERILGKALVDGEKQRVRHELFDPARQDDLIVALLEPSPELATSPAAIGAAEPEARDETIEDEVNDKA